MYIYQQTTIESHWRKVLASPQIINSDICSTGDEMGADGGKRPKEMALKGLLAVKLETEKKNKRGAII